MTLVPYQQPSALAVPPPPHYYQRAYYYDPTDWPTQPIPVIRLPQESPKAFRRALWITGVVCLVIDLLLMAGPAGGHGDLNAGSFGGLLFLAVLCFVLCFVIKMTDVRGRNPQRFDKIHREVGTALFAGWVATKAYNHVRDERNEQWHQQ